MTNDEYTLIKDRAKRLLDLVKEKRALEETKKNQKATSSEQKCISRKLDTTKELLDDLLIMYEADVFHRLSREFEDIRSNTNKKLYFLYGFLRDDNTKNRENYMPYLGFNKYFLFVPCNSQERQYVWYKNIIDMEEDIIVPIEEKNDFESKHYIFTRTELPYTDEMEYHKSRLLGYDGIIDDKYYESFDKYRENFFRILSKTSTEEEAVEQTYLRYGKKRAFYKHS